MLVEVLVHACSPRLAVAREPFPDQGAPSKAAWRHSCKQWSRLELIEFVSEVSRPALWACCWPTSRVGTPRLPTGPHLGGRNLRSQQYCSLIRHSFVVGAMQIPMGDASSYSDGTKRNAMY